MNFLVRWLATALTIFLVPYLVDGIYVPNFPAALTMAAVLGVLNLLVKPILVLFTLPLTMLTLGIFYFVINAILFQWAGRLVEGVEVKSFTAALFASLIVSAVSWAFHIRRNANQRRIVWMRTGGPRRPAARAPRSPNPRAGEETIELHEKDSGKWE